MEATASPPAETTKAPRVSPKRRRGAEATDAASAKKQQPQPSLEDTMALRRSTRRTSARLSSGATQQMPLLPKLSELIAPDALKAASHEPIDPESMTLQRIIEEKSTPLVLFADFLASEFASETVHFYLQASAWKQTAGGKVKEENPEELAASSLSSFSSAASSECSSVKDDSSIKDEESDEDDQAQQALSFSSCSAASEVLPRESALVLYDRFLNAAVSENPLDVEAASSDRVASLLFETTAHVVPVHIFDEVLTQAFRLMELVFFARFRRTPRFVAWCQSGGEPSSLDPASALLVTRSGAKNNVKQQAKASTTPNTRRRRAS